MALLGRQQQAEHATTLAVEEQERLEQLRLEQEVERQGLEGSLCVAEQARETLEQQLLELRSERSHLQEQLAQVGRTPCRCVGRGSWPLTCCSGISHVLRRVLGSYPPHLY